MKLLDKLLTQPPTETIVKYGVFMLVVSIAMIIRNYMTINLFLGG